MKIVLGLGILVVITALVLVNRSSRPSPSSELSVSPTPTVEEVNFTATFTIVTRGLTRNFTASMYHNRSSDVYIEANDPSVVIVKKQGITWNDFFSTLPFKLTRDCLTTGTGETFCSGDGGTLKFYRNDVEDPNLLDREIAPGDRVLIDFSGA